MLKQNQMTEIEIIRMLTAQLGCAREWLELLEDRDDIQESDSFDNDINRFHEAIELAQQRIKETQTPKKHIRLARKYTQLMSTHELKQIEVELHETDIKHVYDFYSNGNLVVSGFGVPPEEIYIK